MKDLREYGVEQAGSYKGSMEAYKGMLNKIRSGSILTEQDSVRLVPKTEETKNKTKQNLDFGQCFKLIFSAIESRNPQNLELAGG